MNPPPARMADTLRTETLRIEKVVAEGDGFAHLSDGKVVFVEGALPGELIDVRVVKSSKDFARGVVAAIHEKHAERVTPPCKYVARGCGGCDLQHASPDLQAHIKLGIAIESLERLGKIVEPDVRLSDIRLPAEHFRTTLRLATAPSGRLGFRQRRSHDVVRIDECLVAHPRLNEVIAGVRLRGSAEIVVRVGASSGEVGLWVEPDVEIDGVPDGADGVVQVGATGFVHETVAGRTLRVSNASFFQSSPQAAEALVDAVARASRDAIENSRGPIVDAYGGGGLFASTVVPSDRDVILIEANPAACVDARVNLAAQRATVIESPVELWEPIEASLVIADPARDGLRAAGVEVLARTNAPVIILVSCDPASLGRDARLLVEAGYEFEYAEVLDPFPHTHHVEIVSRFVRQIEKGSN